MAHWNDWDFGEPENKRAAVERHLARLNTTADEAEHPAVTARKAREAAARLAQHDELFGVYPGCTLGAPPPPDKLPKPRYTAGDDGQGAGNDD
jgi:hypothetical protein